MIKIHNFFLQKLAKTSKNMHTQKSAENSKNLCKIVCKTKNKHKRCPERPDIFVSLSLNSPGGLNIECWPPATKSTQEYWIGNLNSNSNKLKVWESDPLPYYQCSEPSKHFAMMKPSIFPPEIILSRDAICLDSKQNKAQTTFAHWSSALTQALGQRSRFSQRTLWFYSK